RRAAASACTDPVTSRHRELQVRQRYSLGSARKSAILVAMAATKDNKNDRKPAPEPAPPDEAAYRTRVPADIRNVAFPAAMRGYDRDAVDAYVRRVNRVIAELEVTRSPQAAVRHAVERVGEQTKTILDEARE